MNKLGKDILENIIKRLEKKGYNVEATTKIFEKRSNSFFFEGLENILKINDRDNKTYIINTIGENRIFGINKKLIYESGKEYNEGLPFCIDKATNEDYINLEKEGYFIDASSLYAIFDISDEFNYEFICLTEDPDEVVNNIESFIKTNKERSKSAKETAKLLNNIDGI